MNSTPTVSQSPNQPQLSSFKFCPWDGFRFEGWEAACPRCGTERSHGIPGNESETLTFKQIKEDPSDLGWTKSLFSKHDFPDNFTHRSFLDSMATNVNVVFYKYWDGVLGGLVATQQFSIVMLFVLLFSFMLKYDVMIYLAVGIDVLTFLVGYFFVGHLLVGKRQILMNNMFRAAIVVAFVAFTSPILRTLTGSFSNDTIYTISTVLFVIHLLTHDYDYVRGRREKYASPVSLNAAIFSSAILASRLPSAFHACILICFALECFALGPFFFKSVTTYSEELSHVVTLLLFLLGVVLFFPVNRVGAMIYVAGVFIVLFVLPRWLVSLQQFKQSIRGPWDEGVGGKH